MNYCRIISISWLAFFLTTQYLLACLQNDWIWSDRCITVFAHISILTTAVMVWCWYAISSLQAFLTGCSAGGLATYIHCDGFRALLPKDSRVKCLADGGFFLDVYVFRSPLTALDVSSKDFFGYNLQPPAFILMSVFHIHEWNNWWMSSLILKSTCISQHSNVS